MHNANDDTLVVLGPWITNVSNDVPRLRAVVDDSSVSVEERSTAKVELIASLTLLTSLQQILQEVGETHENLVGTAFAETHDRLNLLTLRAQWLVESLDTLGQVIGAQPRQLVLAEIEHFRQITDGENNVPSLRARELTLLATGEELRRENARLSRVLTASVHLLVRGTKLDISQATSRARAVQRRSSITLILLVSLSLASSVLIVWLYVNRNLVARLTGLSDSMLAIAGGNLKAILPPTGSDEIGRMAAALTVFRDTAVEVEEQNLREIAEARKRLIDAIESISEGFSLYDADDQLVVCNSTYKQLMYPGIKDVVKPGVSFETIIREAGARGLIRDAEGRIEEWVAERLARHRSPGEPHLQGRSDGRWILISERKTDDGGTVAVYADITELKHREHELAEKSNALEQKSNALEQLSKQLAKYLSPQVYDSIFSGKQEVKVASSRKKLTIFFSDIVGFTETADRLESEELTQVLNHYLTEMSRVALDHGATVDKFVGDAILIFFGDPETKGVKEDALACVSMAIAMRERLLNLEDIWHESGIEKPLRVRMGIHTGFCTVGNFGSEDRMDYTIIGGAVNTASRLESLATPGEILISYETFAHVRDQIYCEGHGEAEVKGIAYPVATYQVVDSHENIDRERYHFCEEHPNVRVDLDFDSMTSDDRGRAEKILHRALDLLSQFKKPAKRGKL
jgi:class 3 adenylate cyclase/PAS domain-containing protein